MKKVYLKKEYKKWHKNRSRKISLNKRNKKVFLEHRHIIPINRNHKSEYIIRDEVIAPNNLCLLEETELCLEFFKDLRHINNVSKVGRLCYVQMTFRDVNVFDYSTICILIAIIGDLKSKGIYLRADFPKNKKCKEYLIESGLLNVLFDEHGKPFKKSKNSELLFIEKGTKRLTTKDNIRISQTVKNVVEHLTGESAHCKGLRKILLEICGNSIEWGGTHNRQWLIGIKYDNERVIFTITDVGKGILKSLTKKENKLHNNYHEDQHENSTKHNRSGSFSYIIILIKRICTSKCK